MKPILAIAAVSLLALSAPAFAQSSTQPGGATAGSGQNPPGSAGVANSPTGMDNGSTMQNGGSMRMKEGRAATRDTPAGDKADDTPKSVRGDQNGQGMAK